MKMILFGLLCLLPLVFAGSPCPDEVDFLPCHCSRNSERVTTLYCKKNTSHAQILSVVKTVSDEKLIIDRATIHSDFLQSIGEKFFGEAIILEAYFQTANLKSVDAKAFSGQERSLTIVEFSQTGLTVPPASCLTGLKRMFEYRVYKNLHIAVIDSQFYNLVPKTNEVRILDFSGNQITTVDLNVKDHFPKLRQLFLDYNQIESAPKIKMDADGVLTGINLSYNKLGDVPADLFDSMPVGSTLNLRKNSIGNLYEDDVKKIIKKSISLNLMDNPIGCNCNMKWLTNYTSSSHFHVEARCSTPANMRKYFLSKLRKSSFSWCT